MERKRAEGVIDLRVAKAAETSPIALMGRIVWCHLNEESEKSKPDKQRVQVYGSTAGNEGGPLLLFSDGDIFEAYHKA